MWQVGDARDSPVVVSGKRRNHIRTDQLSHGHHAGPGLHPLVIFLGEIHSVVIGDHPHGTLEQALERHVPPGIRSAGHGVAAHETIREAMLGDQRMDFFFHAGHVGKAHARCVLGQRLQQPR